MKIDKIPSDAVLMPGTRDEYVDPRGNVYGFDRRNRHRPLPYRKEMTTIFGYWYVPINYETGRKTCRVHRVVAEVFVPNPNNYPIVMHKDNNKKNNRPENLMWGTVSMNTKQAYNDGLAKNTKGYEDSQSHPCDMYDTSTNRLLGTFGSAREAGRETGLELSTICRQMQDIDAPLRKSVYFTCHGEGPRDHPIIAQVDMATHHIIATYPNCEKAGRAVGMSGKNVAAQCNLGRPPKWAKLPCYFKRMYLKGEEIIEIQSESRVGGV